MSFFFQTIAIPFWFIIFILASAMPLWIKWYKKIHKKYFPEGNLKNKFRRSKSTTEMKEDVLKKATEHLKENGGSLGNKKSKKTTIKKSIDPDKKKNIQTVLKMLAASGETGILSKSLSDRAQINSIETTNALTYLIEKKYAEAINSTSGTMYYLTELGRRYCINKKINIA